MTFGQCIAYLKDWLLSHPLEMRIITVHRAPAPAGDGCSALEFIGHHDFFFFFAGMERRQNGNEPQSKYEGRWVKSMKIGKTSNGQISECGCKGIQFGWLYVTSTRIAITYVDGANAFICTEYDFNLISGVCPPPDAPRRLGPSMCYAAMSIARGKAPAGSAPYPIELRHSYSMWGLYQWRLLIGQQAIEG
jgi:hypothetical protein